MYDYIIIGAGYGGLTAAALLQKQGYNCLILEAHTLIGGCASYYKRKDFSFDVGATTLSGVLAHQPIGKLVEELELDIEFEKVDPGIIIRKDGEEFKRFSNRNKWVEEIASKVDLSKEIIFKIFTELDYIEERAWQALDNNADLMPKDFFGYLKLIKNIQFLDIAITPFISLKMLLDKYQITDEKFIKIIDEILLISTQNTHADVPLMSAALGLGYPAEVYYSYGGITSLGKAILQSYKSKGGEIKFKQEVNSLTKNDCFELTTIKGDVYKANKVISNIPIWNMAQITEGKAQRYYQNLAANFDNAWGAFVTYLVIKSDIDLDGLYYQIHSDKLPNCHSGSVFVSFSHKDDRQRAPECYRTVTISTHCKAQEWIGLEKDAYHTKKYQTQMAIIHEFLKNFPEFEEEDIKQTMSGTPKTFQFFTKRDHGFVGGIPHSVKQPLITFPNQNSPIKGLYQVGDTAFPGQGIATVIYSAQALVNKLI